MGSSSLPSFSRDKHMHTNLFKERFLNLGNPASFLLYCLAFTTLFGLYLLKSFQPIRLHFVQEKNSFIGPQRGNESCDLFKGQWVPEARASVYTNWSCPFIPYLRNCFMHGRKDTDFLHWRWKPDRCELPPFDPKAFLAIVRGKTMGFIGDSLARNQISSLLCLLSIDETPIDMDKDADAGMDKYAEKESRFRSWAFPKHNFTLMLFWSQFLVTAEERVNNGTPAASFDLHLDKTDENWSQKLKQIDYAIISDAHWFFRKNYLYEGGNLIGCIFCQEPNVTDLGPHFAIRRAFRAAFSRINEGKDDMITFLRTYSPGHFENGAWNTGGNCNRTRPITTREKRHDSDLELRNIQVEEIERARKEGMEKGKKNSYHVIDVTAAMAVRPDGHPGVHWGNPWMKGYSDCIHWCLPGPIDSWNQLLLGLLSSYTYEESSLSAA